MARMTLDPKKPRKGATDWAALDAMSDEAVEAAARADPDAQPLTDEQLARMRRVPDVKAIRKRLGLTQREFTRTYRLALGTLRDWEQGRTVPEGPARVLLTVIDRDSKAVAAALRNEPASYPEHAESTAVGGGLEESASGPERYYLLKLRNHAEDTLQFLSNDWRIERERSVCRAFLRCLGVSFRESELVQGPTEPTDISFREANFQVTEMHEPGRRRTKDWEDRLKNLSNANLLEEVMEPCSPPKFMDYSRLSDLIADQLESGKSRKYSRKGKAKLDVLVYVCLSNCVLNIRSESASSNRLLSQGWRSVSALFPPFGVVLAAQDDAPKFLQNACAKPRNEWSEFDTLFEPSSGSD